WRRQSRSRRPGWHSCPACRTPDRDVDLVEAGAEGTAEDGERGTCPGKPPP
ncbi:unnamed protein product, partial [Heterosigma akashiwo]